uniref:Progranulin L n=1 Tax=Lethenteron reissneri TaxID=7753 RepID=A0A976T6M2_LETRI|nr:progranulin precursor L [Lethenteron reissneri]
MMRPAVVAALLTAVAGSIMCPDGQQCPDGNTCCLSAEQGYGCCPLPAAVCCSDGLHCCPSGTVCDLAHGKCQKGKISVPWLEKTPTFTPQNKQCADGTSCGDDATCCPLASGQYGCCSLEDAVCCSDYLHCCPRNTMCDLKLGKCVHGKLSIPWVSKYPSKQAASDVRCDDFTSCPDQNTCCILPSGQWGCCPLPKAVCCDDKVHCCPEGTTCNVTAQTCNQATLSLPWSTKTPALRVTGEPNDVQCDDQVGCPDGNTCCKTDAGDWACCPLVKAVCCDDHEHCCPHGTTCNLPAQTCDKGALSLPWSTKMPALRVAGGEPNAVICDDQSSCPDGNTCCKTSSGDWGCCPLPKAVCCNDHQHCCPEGTTCNLPVERCDKGALSLPWSTKTPALRIAGEPNDVKCDDQYGCPDQTTCCKTAGGDWACCPLVKAVCCDDHEHCCPHGTTCNLPAQTCDKGALSLPWSTKMPALRVAGGEPNDVKCDDQVSCPDGNTCCKTSSGEWGCCPLVKAVCCDDHEHCCPHGTTCNLPAQTCDKGALSLPWSTKTPALKVAGREPNDVKCDDQYGCPDQTTCCKTAGGDWACCPLVKAVCCDDHEHCCPEGTTCNLPAQTCDKGALSLPWSTKTPALRVAGGEPKDVKCDDQVSCPDQTTCCKTASGDWGCCPLVKAVCCDDHEHCCPEGTTCNVPAGSCDQGQLSLPWSSRTPARTRLTALLSASAAARGGSVRCDSAYACPDGTTCCQLPQGQWGCCPLPLAICCSDFVHCCPSGYTCDLAQASCIKKPHFLTWAPKAPAKARPARVFDLL